MEDGFEFKWGAKKEIRNGSNDKQFQYYESFSYRAVNYSLYDCAYFYQSGFPTSHIGKVVNLYETPSRERKVEALWLFFPMDIRNFLGDVEPKWNELFLASGHGKGLCNTNDVETIIGKCQVICTSEDKRNGPASKDVLSKADYFFNRTFDVANQTISEKFPDEIAGIKVEYLLNKIEPSVGNHRENLMLKDMMGCTVVRGEHRSFGSENLNLRTSPLGKGSKLDGEIKDMSKVRPLGKSFIVEDNAPFKKKPSLVDGKYFVSQKPGLIKVAKELKVPENHNLRTSPLEEGPKPVREVKDMSKVRPLGESFNVEDTLPLKKKPSLVNGKYFVSQKPGSINVAKELKVPENQGVRLAAVRSLRIGKEFTHVTRRPDSERKKWFKQMPWEDRLQKAQETGTLVLLENMDPSFTSSEIEDIVWQVFNEKVQATMVRSSMFSNPINGKAFVIFKTKFAAGKAIFDLNEKCLILSDGRPVIARRRNLREPSNETSFYGHLVLEELKLQRQSYDMRTAVSTAHCAQPNSLEYEMALHWLLLQEQSDICWKALHEGQLKEMTELMDRLKHTSIV